MNSLITLAPVDMVIIGAYFVAVLLVGFYLKGKASTGEDFFLAGREMTAWVAGLSFVSANLGALELMGWAAAAYQYGILAAHWYWIGAIPAMLFMGVVMMPFYYISKTHSVPGFLQLRYGESSRALSATTYAFMTLLMSGIDMYAMALVMKVVLGWDINFSIWVSSVTVGIYVALGGLRSAIFNEVLQFFLIWLGALLIPILGLIEAGGWTGLGLGNGIIKMGFLPERSTDYIFSVICEELGMVGACLLLGLLIVWIWQVRRAALNAADRFGQLLAGALGFVIAIQAMLHIAVNLAVAPPKGIGLPFISAGGTSMIIMAAAVAMIVSVTARRKLTNDELTIV